jgi:hypothetical protein
MFYNIGTTNVCIVNKMRQYLMRGNQLPVSAARLVPVMFYNFYLVKNHKISDNTATTEDREKISTYLESLELYNLFDACWTKSNFT